jgi:hypothetical protein
MLLLSPTPAALLARGPFPPPPAEANRAAAAASRLAGDGELARLPGLEPCERAPPAAAAPGPSALAAAASARIAVRFRGGKAGARERQKLSEMAMLD